MEVASFSRCPFCCVRSNTEFESHINAEASTKAPRATHRSRNLDAFRACKVDEVEARLLRGVIVVLSAHDAERHNTVATVGRPMSAIVTTAFIPRATLPTSANESCVCCTASVPQRENEAPTAGGTVRGPSTSRPPKPRPPPKHPHRSTRLPPSVCVHEHKRRRSPQVHMRARTRQCLGWLRRQGRRVVMEARTTGLAQSRCTPRCTTWSHWHVARCHTSVRQQPSSRSSPFGNGTSWQAMQTGAQTRSRAHAG